MLKLSQVTKTFPGLFEPVLNAINLEIKANEYCILLGSNGSGKSTLLKTIAGDYQADSGQIQLNKGHKQTHNQSIAMVVQDVNQGTVPELTVLENLVLCEASKKTTQATSKSGFSFYNRYKNDAIAILETLNIGLEAFIDRPVSTLSGGQRQMLATLMAIKSGPDLLLLDEHTSALDPNTQKILMEYTAQSIIEQQLTCVMITHNLADALKYGNRLVMLHKGRIVFDYSEKEKKELNLEKLLSLYHYFEDKELLSSSIDSTLTGKDMGGLL